MKAIAVSMLIFYAGNLVFASSNASPTVDWRLAAFDEANGYLAKARESERIFIVGKEPKLANFYKDLLGPWLDSTRRLGREVFVKKLAGKTGLGMEKSPWVWALDTPVKSDELKIWFDDDNDGVVREAYNDMIKKLEALRAADNLMKLRNEVYGKYRSEVYRSEATLVSELNALEDRVRKHIAGEGLKS